MKIQIGPLLASIIACQGAGFLGSFFTFSAIDTWYATLQKPSFNPPNWIFGPVWITLYTLMGISAYLIWNQGLERREVKTALVIFGIQLALNVLWSLLFFGAKSPSVAFAEIVFLWFAILLTITSFLKISKPAGLLLIPYLLWTSFATLLNFYIFKLN